MDVVAFTDPLGTDAATVSWEGPPPSYADGGAQAVRHLARSAIAEMRGVPFCAVHVTLAATTESSATYAADNNDEIHTPMSNGPLTSGQHRIAAMFDSFTD